jgi:hypothetical protein
MGVNHEVRTHADSAVDAVDLPALREKYRQERDKRLRPEGQQQYVRTGKDFAASYQADPHAPVQPRAPIAEDIDVAILGAGFSGIMAGVHLRNAGVSSFNPPIDRQWIASQEPGWQKRRQAHFHRAAVDRFARGESDQICDIWTEINRNLAAELEAEGWPELTPLEYWQRREVMDYRVMERMRRRVDSIVRDKATAEALKPWYRFPCKRPCSNDEYYETFNRPNVRLIDVSATRGVERMTRNGFVHEGAEYPIDCLICASGFEVTSDLDQRWGIDVIEGRNGLSLYQHWADGFRTLHGAMAHGFPNQFFTGYLQGGFNATTTEQFGRQGYHIAYIVKEALARGLRAVEPSHEAQEQWVRTLRSTAIDLTEVQRECTPSYFNNEGAEKIRWYLGESYGPGWDAFERLVQDWREKGDMEGLVLAV